MQATKFSSSCGRVRTEVVPASGVLPVAADFSRFEVGVFALFLWKRIVCHLFLNIFEINPGGIRLEHGTELFEISKTYSFCALLKLKMKVVLRVRWLLDQFDAFTLSRSQQDLSSNAPKLRTRRRFCRKQSYTFALILYLAVPNFTNILIQ